MNTPMLDPEDVRRGLHEAAALLPPVDAHLPGMERALDHAARRHRMTLGIAAACGAAAVAAAVVITVVVAGSSGHRSAPAGPTITGPSVICRSTNAAGVAADKTPLEHRLAGFGMKHATVAVHGDEVTLSAPNAAPSRLAQACAPTQLGLRPVVAPSVPDASGKQAQPLAGLHFTIPSTEASYARLTVHQRAEVRHALASLDCAKPLAADEHHPTAACDGAGSAYLLGPAVVIGPDIKRAVAQAPNAAKGQTEWTIDLSMSKSAQAVWTTYTAQHNAGSSPTPGASGGAECGAGGIPCADYVAIVVDGGVVSDPLNEGAINGDTEVSGGFTGTSAKTLAAQLSSALPVPLVERTVTLPSTGHS